MTILETVMGLCLLLIFTAMVHTFNITLSKQMILKEQKLTKITEQYKNQWNTRL